MYFEMTCFSLSCTSVQFWDPQDRCKLGYGGGPEGVADGRGQGNKSTIAPIRHVSMSTVSVADGRCSHMMLGKLKKQDSRLVSRQGTYLPHPLMSAEQK